MKKTLEGLAATSARSTTLPDAEFQLLRRMAFEDERTQQAVLTEAVAEYYERWTKKKVSS